jgi:hypothetical protein
VQVFSFRFCYRLQASPTSTTAENERMLLYVCGATLEPYIDAGDVVSNEDPVAKSNLRQFQPSILERYSPRHTVGDGSCCYWAFLLALFGTEEKHSFI